MYDYYSTRATEHEKKLGNKIFRYDKIWNHVAILTWESRYSGHQILVCNGTRLAARISVQAKWLMLEKSILAVQKSYMWTSSCANTSSIFFELLQRFEQTTNWLNFTS